MAGRRRGMRGTLGTTAVLAGLMTSSCGGAQTPAGGTGSADDPPTTAGDEEGTTWDTTRTDVLVTADRVDELPSTSPYPSTLPTLAIRYTVRNDGTGPLLVATERGHDQASSSNALRTPMAVWVGQGSREDLARLSKQVFDAPADVDLAAPWRAPAELLEPGAELEGYVVVPVPLQGDLPGASSGLILTEEELVGSASRVEVCLHVVPLVEGMSQDEILMGMAGGLACSDHLQVPEGSR